jgi:uncharacterized membrane protein
MTDTPNDPKPDATPGVDATSPAVSHTPTMGVDGDKTLPVVTYALLLGGAVSAGALAIAALILAYVSRDQAPEWVKSHYTFIIRTFWIGLGASVIGMLTAIIGIGVLILGATFIWVLVRGILGLVYASKGEPYPRPQNWLA